MTPTTIQQVQDSFRAVAEISDLAADIFYDRLFAADPSLQALFPADLSEQKRKLMKALAMAVASLEKTDALVPVLREMGARHAGYGVQAGHYATVGTALLETLEAGLGEAFTPECRAAWVEVYTLVAEVMQSGASEASAAA